MSRRISAIAIAVWLLAGLLVAGINDAASAAPVRSTSSVSNNSVQTVQIPVSPGLNPAQISGRLSAPRSDSGQTIQPGTVTVTAGGVAVYSGPARATNFSSPLQGARVTGGTLPVVVTYTVPGLRDDFCADNRQQVDITIQDIRLSGRQTTPSTVANFLSPGVTGVNVVVPENASQELVQAGLSAVAATTYRYDGTIPVRLSVGNPDPRIVGLAGSRIVSVSEGPNPVKTSISSRGVPELSLSGQGGEIAKATAALGGEQIALATSDDTEGLTQEFNPSTELTQSFGDLGSSTPSIQGWGTQSIYVGVKQSQFGGGISDVKVKLVGTNTQIPDGAIATLNTYWNDQLIASRVLTDGTSINFEASVPDSIVQADNGLRVVLSSVPANGNCTGNMKNIPIGLSLDGQLSQVTANLGQTLDAGFSRFPQALGSQLPVAFGSGTPEPQAVVEAGLLVYSLQAASQQQLSVSVVPLSEIEGTSTAGLIVGANEDVSNNLSSPLRLAEFRSVTSPDATFGVGVDLPYAALQAFATGNRNLLMLGSWTPEGQPTNQANASSLELAEYVANRQGGWNALGSDILFVGPGTTPQQLDSNSVVPQPSVVEEYNSVVWWVLAVIGIFAALGLWRYLSVRNTRRKITKYVDAQETADKENFGEADEL